MNNRLYGRQRGNKRDIGRRPGKNHICREKSGVSFFDAYIVRTNAAIFSERLNRVIQMTPLYFHDVEVKVPAAFRNNDKSHRS